MKLKKEVKEAAVVIFIAIMTVGGYIMGILGAVLYFATPRRSGGGMLIIGGLLFIGGIYFLKRVLKK